MRFAQALALVGFLGLCGCGGPADADFVVRGVRVIDLETGRISEPGDVWIAEGRVSATTTSGAEASQRTREVDAHGLYLMPGLWDMHAHVYGAGTVLESVAESAGRYVRDGIVGVRDLGTPLDSLHALRAAASGAQRPFPQIVPTGPIVAQADYGHPLFVRVADSTEARAVVEGLLDRGATALKVHDWIDPGTYRAIVRSAVRRGVEVVGHIPVTVGVGEVLREGQRSIEHLGGLTHGVLRACSDHDASEELDRLLREVLRQGDTAPAYRRVLSAEFLSPIVAGFSQERCAEVARAMAADSVWTTPNLVLWRLRMDMAETERDRRALQDVYGLLEIIVSLFHREGVPLLAGVDEADPYDLHDELASLVDAGLPPLAALQAATVNAAKRGIVADSVGAVTVGGRADLLLLRENPLADIDATRSLAGLFLRGQYYSPDELGGGPS